ncbi:hypothetical protein BpHYR1_015327 [Brachionus plicatilis]|uniref:Uncharacterized protein n=1 Tax=Brachionus plicatilis TaxID=10195 RepID=A0A3M7QFF9_BRAPC|nr:hypothetical protein BpHYR1_015327 [Brachionus plicatilis]
MSLRYHTHSLLSGVLRSPLQVDQVSMSRIYYLSKFWISKIFFWTVLWPASLHTVGRLTAFQLAGHHTSVTENDTDVYLSLYNGKFFAQFDCVGFSLAFKESEKRH